MSSGNECQPLCATTTRFTSILSTEQALRLTVEAPRFLLNQMKGKKAFLDFLEKTFGWCHSSRAPLQEEVCISLSAAICSTVLQQECRCISRSFLTCSPLSLTSLLYFLHSGGSLGRGWDATINFRSNLL